MAVMDSPQLVEGQPARLDMGGSVPAGGGATVDTSVPCRVIGFSGGDVVLALGARPSQPLEQGDVGYLLLESRGQLHALRGEVAAPAGEELVLRLSDDIRLGQRRVFSRAPVPLPAALRSVDDVRAWKTVTQDVSAGGVRVARRGVDPGGGRLELSLTVGDHTVVADVRVVRATADDIGLRFERIERDDRLLLASLALAWHRRA